MVGALKLIRCSRPLTLPDDILFDEILLRIPLLSLVRFRSVSKGWCSTLSGPKFMAAYHKRRRQIQAGVVFDLYMNRSQIHYYTYNNIIDNQLIFNQTMQLELPAMLVSTETVETYTNENNNSIRRWTFETYTNQINISIRIRRWSSMIKKRKRVVPVCKVVGYCDGIMCFLLPPPRTNHDPYTEQFLMWDLTLGKTTLSLPSSYDYFTYDLKNPDEDIIFGMGYDDKSSQDYKVIRASFFRQGGSETMVVKTSVYSLRSNTWRSFEATLPHTWCTRDPGVYVDGVLYWLEDGYSRLLTFCLANEVFDRIPLLKAISNNHVHVILTNLNMGGQHKLGLFTQNYRHNWYNPHFAPGAVSLWVMLDSSKSWTKLYDIDLGTRLQRSTIINHQFLLAESADDDDEGQWFVYDFRTCKKVSVMIKDEVDDPCLYRSSLLL